MRENFQTIERWMYGLSRWGGCRPCVIMPAYMYVVWRNRETIAVTISSVRPTVYECVVEWRRNSSCIDPKTIRNFSILVACLLWLALYNHTMNRVQLYMCGWGEEKCADAVAYKNQTIRLAIHINIHNFEYWLRVCVCVCMYRVFNMIYVPLYINVLDERCLPFNAQYNSTYASC